MSDALPFIEIEIQHTSDSEKNPREILDIIAQRNILSPFNSVSWKGTDEKPILRLDFQSHADFEESYKNGEEMMVKFLSLLEDGTLNIEELRNNFNFQEQSKEDWKVAVTFEDMYLILKYRTNTKAPMRASYKFSEWFVNFFHEHIMYEEVEDGFLFFFHRKQDFLNSNLNKSNPKEFKQWLKTKHVDFQSKIVKKFFNLLNPE